MDTTQACQQVRTPHTAIRILESSRGWLVGAADGGALPCCGRQDFPLQDFPAARRYADQLQQDTGLPLAWPWWDSYATARPAAAQAARP